MWNRAKRESRTTGAPGDLGQRAASLRWHHAIDLGNGVVTPGNTPLEVLKAQADVYFEDSLHGLSVLDVGCWDGFNSFEAERRGAARVLATDHFAWSEDCWGDRASFDLAHSALGSRVEVADLDLPDLTLDRVGMWDVVLFAGVFYHLRHPFHALEALAPLARRTFIIETHLDALDIPRPAMIFYPGSELANDHTNWWGPNVECINAMLADVGFASVKYTPHPIHSGRGIFVARR